MVLFVRCREGNQDLSVTGKGIKMVGWGLVLILGYVCPTYECIKIVEMNEPDIEQLLFWILVVGLTFCETIVHLFIAWVPMLGEAKLAFFIYLWFHKTIPYVSKHQIMIDHFLLKVTTRAGGSALFYWKKAASYGLFASLFDSAFKDILNKDIFDFDVAAETHRLTMFCSFKCVKMLKNYLLNCQPMMADKNGIARRTVWFFLATCSWVFCGILAENEKETNIRKWLFQQVVKVEILNELNEWLIQQFEKDETLKGGVGEVAVISAIFQATAAEAFL
ncbi:hypothetical protein Pfo_021429 [Paulownia fortunei]|nr:hypothetical protein Pfo_021429 [Paulownia fortunei]